MINPALPGIVRARPAKLHHAEGHDLGFSPKFIRLRSMSFSVPADHLPTANQFEVAATASTVAIAFALKIHHIGVFGDDRETIGVV